MLVQTLGLILLLSASAIACPVEPHEFMLSQMRSFGQTADESGISEADFRAVFNRVHDYYQKDFEAHGLGVDLIIDYQNDWFNAQTGWVGSNKVKFFYSGALAKAKYMTKDALMYIACHEVGHHFGGIPKKEGKWSTSEGGADYYAALKCMRSVLKNDPENSDAEKLELPESVKAKCREVYPDDDEYRLCLRTTKAGDDMARAFAHKRSKEEIVTMLLQNPPPAPATNTGYPSHSCRAETAYQGAICSKGPEFPVSFTDEADGYCHEKNGDTFGMRPACWFKPTLE